MPDFRRAWLPGGTFFFTVVTARRFPIFHTPLGRDVLRQAIREVRRDRPWDIVAFVLLPDHLHTIWTLPEGDSAYAERWSLLKRRFTRLWLAAGGREQDVCAGQVRQGRRGVFQRRYWEHVIRDEQDLARHMDYIHYNPVKHGLVSRPIDWPWSSLHRYVQKGVYPADWSCADSAARSAMDDIAKTTGE